jgi:choline dehydrogenase-like flavoprotein
MKIIESDICIVGSGMGGGTLALRLAEAGLQPLVIEAGSETPDPSAAGIVHTGRPFGLDQSRAIELGGGTNLWHGVVSPLDRRDFLGSDEYSGWPLDYDTMVPYWSKALSFLGFKSPELIHFNQLGSRLKRLAKDIDYDERQVIPKLFRVMGKPRRLKDDLIAAANAGKLKLMENVTALECIADTSGAHVRQLVVGQNGARFIIKARKYVICAGALATPRLLLNSRTFGAAGLGNSAGNVGKFLMDHPMAFLGKVRFKRSKRAPLFSDIREPGGNRYRIGLVPRQPARLLNSNLYLRPAIPGATPEIENKILLSLIAVRKVRELNAHHLLNLLANPKVLYRVIANRYVLPIRYRAADLFFVTEQTPTAESQVCLSLNHADSYGYPLAQVNWMVSEKDLLDVRRFIDTLISEGLKSEQYTWDEMPSLEKWESSFTSAAHHLGTARMASDACNGVVDTNLKVHGIDNVWICDGSVFPTGGNANPSLTICALAHRLGEHLLKSDQYQ